MLKHFMDPVEEYVHIVSSIAKTIQMPERSACSGEKRAQIAACLTRLEIIAPKILQNAHSAPKYMHFQAHYRILPSLIEHALRTQSHTTLCLIATVYYNTPSNPAVLSSLLSK